MSYPQLGPGSDGGIGVRILHVIAGAKEGGAESIMLDAALALAKAGEVWYQPPVFGTGPFDEQVWG